MNTDLTTGGIVFNIGKFLAMPRAPKKYSTNRKS